MDVVFRILLMIQKNREINQILLCSNSNTPLEPVVNNFMLPQSTYPLSKIYFVTDTLPQYQLETVQFSNLSGSENKPSLVERTSPGFEDNRKYLSLERE